jgi:hypothetical protein
MSAIWSLTGGKQTFRCQHRDLILTREYVRSSPRVGGGQISAAYRRRTGGAPSYAKSSELIRKAHLCELRHPLAFKSPRSFRAFRDPA